MTQSRDPIRAPGREEVSGRVRTGLAPRTPGEHTVTSRATDPSGYVQPTSEELEVKKTFLEQNNQHPRTLIIA